MKRTLTVILLFILHFSASTSFAQSGLNIIESNYSVVETADRLETALEEAGITLFNRISHHEGAADAGLELRPTILILFGNPVLGTPIMQCAPTSAIDLPQKMIIWEEETGRVHIGYNDPAYLKNRHEIEGCDQVLNRVSGALSNFSSRAAGR